LVEIKLQGVGEPLLGRDDFFEMIHYARSRHIWVRTTTNASILHHKENYKRLVDSGVNEIQISIDGATKETFEKIRRGSKFELVVENCKLINDYCKKQNNFLTKMWVVLQRDNIEELRQFVPLSAELGFKRLAFALNLTDWGQDRWGSLNRAVTVEDSVSFEDAQQIINHGERVGLEVGFWNVTEKYATDTPAHLCPWPFERAFVSSDMRIVPCCKIGNPEVSDLGDAHRFTEIWKSDEYDSFRRAHIEGRIPAVCVDCYATRKSPH
jgi:pyrroloquinoline quinone biosynthesis protein E